MRGSFTAELRVDVPTFNVGLMLRGNVTTRNESGHFYQTLLLTHASDIHHTHNHKFKRFFDFDNQHFLEIVIVKIKNV